MNRLSAFILTSCLVIGATSCSGRGVNPTPSVSARGSITQLASTATWSSPGGADPLARLKQEASRSPKSAKPRVGQIVPREFGVVVPAALLPADLVPARQNLGSGSEYRLIATRSGRAAKNASNSRSTEGAIVIGGPGPGMCYTITDTQYTLWVDQFGDWYVTAQVVGTWDLPCDDSANSGSSDSVPAPDCSDPNADPADCLVAIYLGPPKQGVACPQNDSQESIPVGGTVGSANVNGTQQTRSVVDVNTVYSYSSSMIVNNQVTYTGLTPVGWTYLDDNGGFWFTATPPTSSAAVPLGATPGTLGQGSLVTSNPSLTAGITAAKCWKGGSAFYGSSGLNG
jgi:hypothetical protein